MSLYWKITFSLTIWPNMKASGQKSQFQTFQWIGENLEMQSKLFKNSNFPFFYELEKTWKYTQPQANISKSQCNLWVSWEKLWPNLSFTVENKMESSHKRSWSQFQLKINDWDIPFLKNLRIFQWIGKNSFRCGNWNEPIKLIRECVRLKIKI